MYILKSKLIIFNEVLNILPGLFFSLYHPDVILKDQIRDDWESWENKDEHDDINRK